MKKELVTSLLVAVSMGVGVLGTNIYYNNLPKTQVEQQTADKEIEKEKENIISKYNSNLFNNKEKDKQVKVWNINCIVNNYEGRRTNINNK